MNDGKIIRAIEYERDPEEESVMVLTGAELLSEQDRLRNLVATGKATSKDCKRLKRVCLELERQMTAAGMVSGNSPSPYSKLLSRRVETPPGVRMLTGDDSSDGRSDQ